MKYAKLGKSDLNVSRICMGFGDAANGQHNWTVDEAQPTAKSSRASRSWPTGGASP